VPKVNPKSEARCAENQESEYRNPKQIRMGKEENEKPYDLEKRSELFAKRVRVFVKKLTRIDANIIDGRQILRRSGSVAANYIEANESLSKKDFVIRVKICRKEAKETAMWARLLDTFENPELEREREALAKEAGKLMNIFGAILRKSE
jgi:four helix bundle protein